MKTKYSLLTAALAALIIAGAPLAYADEATSHKDKASVSGTTTAADEPNNDTSHKQNTTDQTKASQKSKNSPGD